MCHKLCSGKYGKPIRCAMYHGDFQFLKSTGLIFWQSYRVICALECGQGKYIFALHFLNQ